MTNNKKWSAFNEHQENIEKSWAKTHPKKGQIKSVQFGNKRKEKMRGFSEPLLS